jgi:undecaprenyl diphosphate synthase
MADRTIIYKNMINPKPKISSFAKASEAKQNQKFKVIPQHIAIIMDGNRRWAKEHGLPPIGGHQYVVNSVLEPLVEHASQLGVKYLTFWAFSTENWQRDPKEVSGIMNIFRQAIITFGEKMHKKGIRIKMIGDLSKFSPDIQKSVNDLIELTKNNTRITVIFALNYGGRDEIVRGMNRAISHQPSAISSQQPPNKNNNHEAESCRLTAESFNNYLDTVGIPDPEFIIRTGGEQRLSGFLLWQSEYSELFFPSWRMPEFTPKKLDEAIEEYTNRTRRFGK